jgi:hypothetical protein
MKKTYFKTRIEKLYLTVIAVIVVFFINSCSTKNRNSVIKLEKEIIIDSLPGSGVFLTKDNKDNIVLSWVRQSADSGISFCFARSYDEGKTFGNATEVPGSSNVSAHGENIPKIIFKPSGEIIAVWGAANPNPKNAYSGLVYYSSSGDNGKSWSNVENLSKDTASYDQRYFDVALLPDGEVGIIWLDNRKRANKEGSGLYFAKTSAGHGFMNEKLIAEPCCQCCKTDLFVDSRKNIHALYRAIINDSIRDMVHVVSLNNAESFSVPERISNDNWVINGCPHTGPVMSEDKSGLCFSWFTGGDSSGIWSDRSTDNGKTFTHRQNISGKSAKHCQMATSDEGSIVIVWDEAFSDNNGNVSNRIGISVRNDDKTLAKLYISEENKISSYPVLCALNSNKWIIAYTKIVNDADRIVIKQISL